MDVYLVRRIEDKGILGIFWGSKADVWDAVDELDDPDDFEAARLQAGALYARGEIPAAPVRGDVEREDYEGYDWGPYTESERFDLQFYGQDRLRWKRLDYADEGVGLIRRVMDRIQKQGA